MFDSPSASAITSLDGSITGSLSSCFLFDLISSISVFYYPFPTFLSQKFFHSEFLDVIQVFYHAHMVFCKVALIQCLQSIAWVIWAFITKPDASFWKQLKRISHIGAVLSPWNTSWTIFFMKPFFYLYHFFWIDKQCINCSSSHKERSVFHP